MRGDVLARGAASATFPSLSHVSQEKWNAIWDEKEPAAPVKKTKKIKK